MPPSKRPISAAQQRKINWVGLNHLRQMRAGKTPAEFAEDIYFCARFNGQNDDSDLCLYINKREDGTYVLSLPIVSIWVPGVSGTEGAWRHIFVRALDITVELRQHHSDGSEVILAPPEVCRIGNRTSITRDGHTMYSRFNAKDGGLGERALSRMTTVRTTWSLVDDFGIYIVVEWNVWLKRARGQPLPPREHLPKIVAILDAQRRILFAPLPFQPAEQPIPNDLLEMPGILQAGAVAAPQRAESPVPPALADLPPLESLHNDVPGGLLPPDHLPSPAPGHGSTYPVTVLGSDTQVEGTPLTWRDLSPQDWPDVDEAIKRDLGGGERHARTTPTSSTTTTSTPTASLPAACSPGCGPSSLPFVPPLPWEAAHLECLGTFATGTDDVATRSDDRRGPVPWAAPSSFRLHPTLEAPPHDRYTDTDTMNFPTLAHSAEPAAVCRGLSRPDAREPPRERYKTDSGAARVQHQQCSHSGLDHSDRSHVVSQHKRTHDVHGQYDPYAAELLSEKCHPSTIDDSQVEKELYSDDDFSLLHDLFPDLIPLHYAQPFSKRPKQMSLDPLEDDVSNGL